MVAFRRPLTRAIWSEVDVCSLCVGVGPPGGVLVLQEHLLRTSVWGPYIALFALFLRKKVVSSSKKVFANLRDLTGTVSATGRKSRIFDKMSQFDAASSIDVSPYFPVVTWRAHPLIGGYLAESLQIMQLH